MDEQKKIKILIDNREIETIEGENLLQVCLRNDIYIPNLCYLEGMVIPSASCRLCFVEVQGEGAPLPSCTLKVKEGMVINTDTESVRELQRTALNLLLSTHNVDCAHCPANKKCELQKIARFLKIGLKSKQFEKYLKDPEVDRTHPLLDYYPNRCVLCGKCVYICNEKSGRPLLSFAKRGLETIISFYGEEDTSSCQSCQACVDICPVSALIFKKQ
jgi:bidirectional [NiFe] hydrogenase diaphorase subunit